MGNFVYIACSIDGYIADQKGWGPAKWLEEIGNPTKTDFGFDNFIQKIDVLVMGRKTYEGVLELLPKSNYRKLIKLYNIPVIVLSKTLSVLPTKLAKNMSIMQGKPQEIINNLHKKGLFNIWIDGGVTIQQFLAVNLIDEMTITTFPILLGGGTKLFGPLPTPLHFKSVSVKTFFNLITQEHYLK